MHCAKKKKPKVRHSAVLSSISMHALGEAVEKAGVSDATSEQKIKKIAAKQKKVHEVL